MGIGRKQKIWAGLSAAALVLGLAGWWMASPVLALRELQQAAQAGDAERFNAHVDYPRLRESLKRQLADPLMRSLDDAAPDTDNGWQQAGAALGALLGRAMIDRSVDLLVRPETVMLAIQEGRMVPKLRHKRPPPEPSTEASAPPASEPGLQWQTEREGLDHYVAWATRPGQPPDQRLGLVLRRSGFATWRLSEVRLPPGR